MNIRAALKESAPSWLFLVLSVVYAVDSDFCPVSSSSMVLTQCDSCPVLVLVLKQCRVDSRLVTIDEQFCATVQAISPVQEIGISHVG